MRYYLGEGYPGIYFTAQEAKCMYYFLKGYTDKQTGEMLNLSVRTVGFYLMNMRHKLGCHSKYELIKKISASTFNEFVKNLSW